jgi:hypothetical protein
MKPVFIIAIVAVVIVLAVIVGNQQMQINNIETQAIFQIEIDRCGTMVTNSNPYNVQSQNMAWVDYTNCMNTAVSAYGNDVQQASWEDMKQEQIELEESSEKFDKMMSDVIMDGCQAKFPAVTPEYHNCVKEGKENIDTLLDMKSTYSP